MGKVITIANQKGGCGKSTTTTFFANKLNEMGYKINVIDADYQRTLSRMREMELANNEEIDEKTLYPITYVPPNKVVDYLEEVEEKYDFIFCDVPGNITDKSVLGILSRSDVLIVLHDANSVGVASTLDFLETIQIGVIDIVVKAGFEPPIVMNLIAKYNENLKIHKLFMNSKDQISDFPWFKHHLRNLQSTFDDMNTTQSYQHQKYNYEFDLIIKEFLSIFK